MTNEPSNDRGGMPLAEFFEKVYRPRRLIDGAESTTAHYGQCIRRMETFLGRVPVVCDLNDETLAGLLAGYIPGHSAHSSKSLREHLLALANLAAKLRYIEQYPELGLIRTPKRIPSAWTTEQMGILLEAAKTERGTIAGIRANRWFVALVLCLYDTGLRIGAMRQCRVDDVDFAKATLFCRAEVQKQRADQIVYMHSQTVQALVKTFPQDNLPPFRGEPPRELLFPWPYHFGTLYNRFNKILKRAGLPSGRRDKFHKIRRSSATGIAAALGRAAAQQHLGHSSARITELYLDTRQIASTDTSQYLPRPNVQGLGGSPANGNGHPAGKAGPLPAERPVEDPPPIEPPPAVDPLPAVPTSTAVPPASSATPAADPQKEPDVRELIFLTFSEVSQTLGASQHRMKGMLARGEFPPPVLFRHSRRWSLATLERKVMRPVADVGRWPRDRALPETIGMAGVQKLLQVKSDLVKKLIADGTLPAPTLVGQCFVWTREALTNRIAQKKKPLPEIAS